MIPVMQRGPYDCVRASVASLFELAYEDVPEFDGDTDKWYYQLEKWLRLRHLSLMNVTYECELYGWHLGSIQSTFNPEWRHSVVTYNGYIVHDPMNGKQDGTVKPLDYLIIFPINIARLPV